MKSLLLSLLLISGAVFGQDSSKVVFDSLGNMHTLVFYNPKTNTMAKMPKKPTPPAMPKTPPAGNGKPMTASKGKGGYGPKKGKM